MPSGLFITKPYEELDERPKTAFPIRKEAGEGVEKHFMKTEHLIKEGIDNVRQLQRMVSETKQSLYDQKRLAYLENMYKDKIQ